MFIEIGFYKENENAIIPTIKSNGDVGMDIHSIEDVLIPPGQTKLVNTGLRLGNVRYDNQGSGLSVLLKIEGRSGLASKGIFPTGGIVDVLAYTGIIKVALVNSTNESYTVMKGDRVAQFVLYPVIANSNSVAKECLAEPGSTYSVSVHEAFSVRDTSDRKESGFGSSGR